MSSRTRFVQKKKILEDIEIYTSLLELLNCRNSTTKIKSCFISNSVNKETEQKLTG